MHPSSIGTSLICKFCAMAAAVAVVHCCWRSQATAVHVKAWDARPVTCVPIHATICQAYSACSQLLSTIMEQYLPLILGVWDHPYASRRPLPPIAVPVWLKQAPCLSVVGRRA